MLLSWLKSFQCCVEWMVWCSVFSGDQVSFIYLLIGQLATIHASSSQHHTMDGFMDGTTAKYTMTIHDLTWFDSMIILGALQWNVFTLIHWQIVLKIKSLKMILQFVIIYEPFIKGTDFHLILLFIYSYNQPTPLIDCPLHFPSV